METSASFEARSAPSSYPPQLEAYLRDNDRAYELVDGKYVAVSASPGVPRISAQRLLLDWYIEAVQRRYSAVRRTAILKALGGRLLLA